MAPSHNIGMQVLDSADHLPVPSWFFSIGQHGSDKAGLYGRPTKEQHAAGKSSSL